MQQSRETVRRHSLAKQTFSNWKVFVARVLALACSRDDSSRIIQMKKIVLSIAAVALLAGFAAGCATQPEKPAAPVVRKG